MGHEVVLRDGSEEMLRIAPQQAEAGRVAAQISFCHADAGQLPELFDAESFDIVICLNLLEYAENPFATVGDIVQVLAKDAVLSLLVRNRTGEVLKEAIRSRHCKLAAARLTAETAEHSIYTEGVRGFDPDEA